MGVRPESRTEHRVLPGLPRRSALTKVPERADSGPSCARRAPWVLLAGGDAVEMSAGQGWRPLRDLPTGTVVVLTANHLFARRRLRSLAVRGGVVIHRELIVLPTLSRPIVVIDDVEPAVGHFWKSFATVPPGLAATAVPAAVVLFLARALPWPWTGAIAPGRVLIGRRS